MPEPTTFIGGMNVPLVLGRANATQPLAELVLVGGTLILRTRWLGMIPTLEAPLYTVESAFELRNTPLHAGIGIRFRDGRVAFFWTWRQKQAVLSALADRGVTIEPGKHPARGLYRMRSTPEAQAALPPLPALFVTLIPALVLLGTAVMIALLVTAEFWWARVIIVVVWLVSSIQTLSLWRRSRPAKG